MGRFSYTKWSHLLDALSQNDEKKVARLIEEGAPLKDLRGNTALVHAILCRPRKNAAWSGQYDCIQKLAELSDPQAGDASGLTPLMAAAENGDAKLVELLLPVSVPKARDFQDETALTRAARAGNPDVLALLAPVSDVNAANAFGLTALARATAADCVDSVKALLAAGADARLAGDRGITPLMVAVSSRARKEIVQALVPVSDLSAKDAEGRTAEDLAAAAGVQIAKDYAEAVADAAMGALSGAPNLAALAAGRGVSAENSVGAAPAGPTAAAVATSRLGAPR
jgi:ankyrin repeat protein